MRLSQPDSAEPPAVAAATIVDEEALDRIVDAVGKNFIPVTFNRNALWDALLKARKTKEIIDRFQPDARPRAKSNSMRRISANQFIANLLPVVLEEIRLLIIVTKRTGQIWSDSDKDIRANGRAMRARYDRPPSTNDWLAGVELPLIFEECFGRKLGRSRDINGPGRPTVRFIAAVMFEMGSQIEGETIVRAMSRFSELRRRRRVVHLRNNNIGQN